MNFLQKKCLMNNLVISFKASLYSALIFMDIFEDFWEDIPEIPFWLHVPKIRLLFNLEQGNTYVDPGQSFYGEFWWRASQISKWNSLNLVIQYWKVRK